MVQVQRVPAARIRGDPGREVASGSDRPCDVPAASLMQSREPVTAGAGAAATGHRGVRSDLPRMSGCPVDGALPGGRAPDGSGWAGTSATSRRRPARRDLRIQPAPRRPPTQPTEQPPPRFGRVWTAATASIRRQGGGISLRQRSGRRPGLSRPSSGRKLCEHPSGTGPVCTGRASGRLEDQQDPEPTCGARGSASGLPQGFLPGGPVRAGPCGRAGAGGPTHQLTRSAGSLFSGDRAGPPRLPCSGSRWSPGGWWPVAGCRGHRLRRCDAGLLNGMAGAALSGRAWPPGAAAAVRSAPPVPPPG